MDENASKASERVTAIAIGSRADAAMDVSIPKTKAMHIHKKSRVSATTASDIAELKLKHVCPECNRGFTKPRGLARHRALGGTEGGSWCLHDPAHAETRSRAGTLTDKAVQRKKRIAKENELEHVTVEDNEIENVYSFVYLGSLCQCDGEDMADVKHRMDIAQARFSSLHHLWKDGRLRRSAKIRLYVASVCSTLTHACEAWKLTHEVRKAINGFNSRCLHVITGKPYRETAVNPDFNLLLAIRKRRLRFLGHILRLDPDRLLKRLLIAYVGTCSRAGSLLEDCGSVGIRKLCRKAANRDGWRSRVNALQ